MADEQQQEGRGVGRHGRSEPANVQPRHLYREASTLPRIVRTIDFDLLSRSVQSRVRQAILGQGVPELLVKELHDDRMLLLNTPIRCVLVALGAVGVEGDLWFRHFGDLYAEGRNIQPPIFAVYHGIAFGLFVAAILALAYTERQTEASPVPRGKYLFPQELVEVKGRRIVFTSLETLRDIEATNTPRPEIALRFADGGWERLRLDAMTNPIQLAERVRTAIDRRKSHKNDPFVELQGAEIKQSATKDAAPMRALGVILLASSVVGAYCGPRVWEQHNALSDEAMFDKVRSYAYAGGSIFEEAAQRYERLSTRHREDLERMRFDHARRNVREGLAYLRSSKRKREATGTGHRHEQEIDEWVFYELRSIDDASDLIGEYVEIDGEHTEELRERALVLSDRSWQAAMIRNNVQAFAELRRKSPNTALDRQAQLEIHSRYERLRGEWMKHPWGDPQMRRLVGALLDTFDERRDPQVLVEVRAAEPNNLTQLDAELSRSTGSQYQPAAPHFTPKLMEAQVSTAMQGHVKSAFQSFFVNDIEFVREARNKDLPRLVVDLTMEAPTKTLLVVPKTGEQLANVQLRYAIRLERTGQSPLVAIEQSSKAESQETFAMFAETYPHAQYEPISQWAQLLYWRIVGSASDELADALRRAM